VWTRRRLSRPRLSLPSSVGYQSGSYRPAPVRGRHIDRVTHTPAGNAPAWCIGAPWSASILSPALFADLSRGYVPATGV